MDRYNSAEDGFIIVPVVEWNHKEKRWHNGGIPEPETIRISHLVRWRKYVLRDEQKPGMPYPVTRLTVVNTPHYNEDKGNNKFAEYRELLVALTCDQLDQYFIAVRI